MNKKLFALLVVSACALQLNAADAGGAQAAAAAGMSATEGAPRDAVSDGDSGSDDGSEVRRAVQAAATVEAVRDDGSAPRGAAAPEDTSTPTPFVMPGTDDNVAKSIVLRLFNKVWTRGVDATQLKDILRHGAENFDEMNQGARATYFNAQDAQWGVNSSRAFKAVRAIVVAGFVKLVRDVLNETEDDDEDEDDVAVAA